MLPSVPNKPYTPNPKPELNYKAQAKQSCDDDIVGAERVDLMYLTFYLLNHGASFVFTVCYLEGPCYKGLGLSKFLTVEYLERVPLKLQTLPRTTQKTY